jgi:hypothetical protein
MEEAHHRIELGLAEFHSLYRGKLSACAAAIATLACNETAAGHCQLTFEFGKIVIALLRVRSVFPFRKLFIHLCHFIHA